MRSAGGMLNASVALLDGETVAVADVLVMVKCGESNVVDTELGLVLATVA